MSLAMQEGAGAVELQHFLSSDDTPSLDERSDGTTEPAALALDDAIAVIGGGIGQALLFGVSGAVWIADAIEVLLLSFIAPALSCEWGLTTAETALIASSVFIGMFLGAASWGVIADKFGRRKAFLAACLCTCLFGFATAMAPSFPWLVLARIWVGFGIGGAPIAYNMLAEFLPPPKRGMVLSSTLFFWTAGSIVEVGLAWWLLPSAGWRVLVFVSALPSALLTLVYPLLPESPRYLLAAGHVAAAEAQLVKMAQLNRRPLPAGFRLKGDTPRTDQDAPQGSRGSVISLVRYSPRRTCLLFASWFLLSFLYYGSIVYSSVSLAKVSASSSSTSGCSLPGIFFLSVMLTTLGELPGLGVCSMCIDCVGRRRILIALLVSATACYWLLLLVTPLTAPHLSLLFGCRASMMGAMSAVYVYTAEAFPTSLRSTALGACSSLARIGGTASPFVAALGGAPAIFTYGSFAATAVLVLWLLPQRDPKVLEGSADY